MFKISIPLPLQIVIDDVGWWSGFDGHAQNEPFRTGINRNHVPEDYVAIVQLGEKLNMRPQAAMVLCEWDKKNILRKLPRGTWMGKKWDNSKWVGLWMKDVTDIISNGKTHIEFVMHGIGHEYWDADGKMSRAEFHDMDNNLRPKEEIARHLDYFQKIMKQHKLRDFPESFVPPAFRYCFGDGFTDILKQKGIKYISTMFKCMKNSAQVQEKFFGVEKGVMIVDRGTDITKWRDMDVHPKGELYGPVCGIHWPNILHPDYSRNDEVVDRWVEFLKPYDEKFDRMLAPDTQTCWAQLAYSACTDIKIRDKVIIFDFSRLLELAPENLLNWFTVKIKTPQNIKFSSKDLEIIPLAQNNNDDYQTLKIKRLSKKGAVKVKILI